MANRRPRRGETNLMVVGVVAACCAAAVALIGALMVHFQNKRTDTICMNNLRQTSVTLIMYATDHNDAMPTLEGFVGGALAPYLGISGLLQCPDGQSADNTDYVYLGEGLLMTEINKPGSTILTHDKLGNHEGSVNCVYADGSVRAAATTATTWEAFRKEREAAGDVILNEPRKLAEEGPKALPTYQ